MCWCVNAHCAFLALLRFSCCMRCKLGNTCVPCSSGIVAWQGADIFARALQLLEQCAPTYEEQGRVRRRDECLLGRAALNALTNDTAFAIPRRDLSPLARYHLRLSPVQVGHTLHIFDGMNVPSAADCANLLGNLLGCVMRAAGAHTCTGGCKQALHAIRNAQLIWCVACCGADGCGGLHHSARQCASGACARDAAGREDGQQPRSACPLVRLSSTAESLLGGTLPLQDPFFSCLAPALM